MPQSPNLLNFCTDLYFIESTCDWKCQCTVTMRDGGCWEVVYNWNSFCWSCHLSVPDVQVDSQNVHCNCTAHWWRRGIIMRYIKLCFVSVCHLPATWAHATVLGSARLVWLVSGGLISAQPPRQVHTSGHYPHYLQSTHHFHYLYYSPILHPPATLNTLPEAAHYYLLTSTDYLLLIYHI